MGKITSLPTIRLDSEYPLLEREEIPHTFKIEPINFKSVEISSYPVLLFHRLMKIHYGQPPQVEVEIEGAFRNQDKLHRKAITLTRTEEKGKWEVPQNGNLLGEGELEGLKAQSPPKEWKYFIKTKSGGIILFGTVDRHAGIRICHLLSPEDSPKGPEKKVQKEGREFVNKILKLAKNEKRQGFSVKKEFEKPKQVGLYILNNVYLFNYYSAEIIFELSEESEQNMKLEFIRYDKSQKDLSDEQEAHIDRYMAACGMYYQSCISYYFMALEGFVNLIYHSFLMESYRDIDWQRDLNLEKKIRFMFFLCNGFEPEHIGPKLPVLAKYRELSSFRNKIFHSKIEDDLKSVCIIEDGFYYNYEMKDMDPESLVANKIFLNKDHVLHAKKAVDDVISLIVGNMKPKFKSLVARFIFREVGLPFWKDSEGTVHLGYLKRK